MQLNRLTNGFKVSSNKPCCIRTTSALQIILSSTKFVSGRNGEIKKRCHDTLVTRVPLCYHHVWPVLSSNLNMWYDTNRAVGML